MIVKLVRGISVTHKVVQIFNLDNELVTVYNKHSGIDYISKSNEWLRHPVEVIVNTPELLLVRQIDANKIGKLKI